MNTSGRTSALSGIITLAVIGLLFFASPAAAVQLLVTNAGAVQQGDQAEFDLRVDIKDGERIPISTVTFTLEGPTSQTCVFDIEGNAISGCDGMTITLKQNSADYGYGYGFGEGFDGETNTATNFGYGYGYAHNGGKELQWRVNWNTTNAPAGEYTITYSVQSDSRDFVAEQASQKITIKDVPKSETPGKGKETAPGQNKDKANNGNAYGHDKDWKNGEGTLPNGKVPPPFQDGNKPGKK